MFSLLVYHHCNWQLPIPKYRLSTFKIPVLDSCLLNYTVTIYDMTRIPSVIGWSMMIFMILFFLFLLFGPARKSAKTQSYDIRRGDVLQRRRRQTRWVVRPRTTYLLSKDKSVIREQPISRLETIFEEDEGSDEEERSWLAQSKISAQGPPSYGSPMPAKAWSAAQGWCGHQSC